MGSWAATSLLAGQLMLGKQEGKETGGFCQAWWVLHSALQKASSQIQVPRPALSFCLSEQARRERGSLHPAWWVLHSAAEHMSKSQPLTLSFTSCMPASQSAGWWMPDPSRRWGGGLLVVGWWRGTLEAAFPSPSSTSLSPVGRREGER